MSNRIAAFVLAVGTAAGGQALAQEPQGAPLTIMGNTAAEQALRARHSGQNVQIVEPTVVPGQRAQGGIAPGQVIPTTLEPHLKAVIMAEAGRRKADPSFDPETICANELATGGVPRSQSAANPNGTAQVVPNLGKRVIKGIEARTGATNEGTILGNYGKQSVQAEQAREAGRQRTCGSLAHSNKISWQSPGSADGTVYSLVNSFQANGFLNNGANNSPAAMQNRATENVEDALKGKAVEGLNRVFGPSPFRR